MKIIGNIMMILGIIGMIVGVILSINTFINKIDDDYNNSYIEYIKNLEETSNIRIINNEYIMYNIEDDNVICREQLHRSGISCWNNTYGEK